MNWIKSHISDIKALSAQQKNLNYFSCILTIVLVCFGIWLLIKQNNVGYWLIGIGLIIITSHITTGIRWLYEPWMFVTQLIGELIALTILTVIFYILITPMMLLRQLKRKKTPSDWQSLDSELDMTKQY